MYIPEKNIKKIIEESIKNKQRFDVIVINRFKITKSESKSALETRQRLRQLGRFYTENDHRKIWEICEVCGKFVQEHTLKEDKVCFPDKTRRKKSKPNNKRSAAAKKAARTKKRKEKAAKDLSIQAYQGIWLKATLASAQVIDGSYSLKGSGYS